MTTITVTIWHNVASDQDDRPGPFLVGFTPDDPMVRVFAHHVAGGRTAESVAEEAFATFNGHPPDTRTADLSRRYYQRQLRSLSFPGNSACCSRSCCLHCRAVWPRSSSTLANERTSCGRQPGTRGLHR